MQLPRGSRIATHWFLRVVVGAEDRPADLGDPLGRIGNISCINQVVLAYRAVNADLVRGHIGAELPVGDVNVLMRTNVGEDREFGFGDNQGENTPDRTRLSFGGNEDGGLSATVLEELAGEESAADPG